MPYVGKVGLFMNSNFNRESFAQTEKSLKFHMLFTRVLCPIWLIMVLSSWINEYISAKEMYSSISFYTIFVLILELIPFILLLLATIKLWKKQSVGLKFLILYFVYGIAISIIFGGVTAATIGTSIGVLIWAIPVSIYYRNRIYK